MGGLTIDDVHKRYGASPALRGLDLTVADGELLVCVGPSGCGKSTLLRLIAGLERLDSGRITLDGAPLHTVHPARRGVAMVFQSYALYPHLSVAANIGFPLRMAGWPRRRRVARVREVAAVLGLEGMLDRRPGALSGGQRQRVALGRAMVREPRLFLFDEPLSNLDAALRARMRVEIKRLHRRLGTTMIYVTHDQVEAMTLADRIAVVRDGVVEQIGTPEALYQRPQTSFVAGFIGTPAMNLLAVTGAGTTLRLVDGPALPVPAPPALVQAAGRLGIRPDAVSLADPDDADLAMRVEVVETLGRLRHLHGLIGEQPFVVETERACAEGELVGLRLPPAGLHLFDDEGRRLPPGEGRPDAA